MFSRKIKILSIMKSALLVALALVMVLCFVGCNKTQDTTGTTGTQTTTSNTPTTTRVPTPSDAKEVLNTYLEYVYNANGDVKTYVAILNPDEMLRDYLKEHNMSEDVYIQQAESQLVANKNELNAQGISYKFEITSETAMTAEDIDFYNKGVLADLGIKMSEGMIFIVEITKYVNGEAEKPFTSEHDLIKIGGYWHIPS